MLVYNSSGVLRALLAIMPDRRATYSRMRTTWPKRMVDRCS